MIKKKLAVIGSGISGLSAAYLLSKKYDVCLFEKNKKLGGHTRTIYFNEKNIKLAVDTGFIVFNENNYPDLVNFFKLLNVKYENSNMSFSVSAKNPNMEYSGKNLISLFSDIKNLFSIKFLFMLNEINNFYKKCNQIKIDDKLANMTLKDFLDSNNFSNYLKKYHIMPMASSIWSSNVKDIENFPLILFINFFKNHGLFKLKNRPEWKFVTGGSNEYIKKIISLNLFVNKTNVEIKSIERKSEKVKIFDINNIAYEFDKLVLAIHPDQVLKILKKPTPEEFEILSTFKYSKNTAFLHKDSNFMPNHKLAWSSWNFIENIENKDKFMLTYWMNKLQKLPTKTDYFVTINPSNKPIGVIDNTTFEHPIFNLQTLKAQKKISTIQGSLNTYYSGSYLGYGFHEDGIQASAHVCKLLGVSLPWLRDNKFYNRLQI